MVIESGEGIPSGSGGNYKRNIMDQIKRWGKTDHQTSPAGEKGKMLGYAALQVLRGLPWVEKVISLTFP
jgi:hypothetical protein